MIPANTQNTQQSAEAAEKAKQEQAAAAEAEKAKQADDGKVWCRRVKGSPHRKPQRVKVHKETLADWLVLNPDFEVEK